MKKIPLLLAAISATALFQSCTTEEYYVTQENIYVSEVFEKRANLLRERGYSETFRFSEPSYEGDMVLIYILWEIDNGADVWRLVPQDVHLGGGDLVTYNYDFTNNDFKIFLDGNFNLDEMTDQEYSSIALNQLFRIVVVPGRVLQNMDSKTQIDHSDYEATIKHYGLQNKTIHQLSK